MSRLTRKRFVAALQRGPRGHLLGVSGARCPDRKPISDNASGAGGYSVRARSWYLGQRTKDARGLVPNEPRPTVAAARLKHPRQSRPAAIGPSTTALVGVGVRRTLTYHHKGSPGPSFAPLGSPFTWIPACSYYSCSRLASLFVSSSASRLASFAVSSSACIHRDCYPLSSASLFLALFASPPHRSSPRSKMDRQFSRPSEPDGVHPGARPPAASKRPPAIAHPSGKEAYGRLVQVLRGIALAAYFGLCSGSILVSQAIGVPLYFIDRDWFYAYVAFTKRAFALTAALMTHIWGPTTMRISGDESIAGQIKPMPDGGVQFSFPERLVLIANHQIYTDWLYLWWIAYANRPGMAGHIYIILKESLKYVPFIGPAMMFYGFIFMSRKMATDQPRLAYRINKLNKTKTGPDGRPYLDPMWLLLFPEGTNLSTNGRQKSAKWANQKGLRDPEHVLLPRSTGILFCLNQLKGTVDYVYDCTVAYEGVPRGKYGEQLFGLASTYFQGRSPKSVNLYWRRYRLADLPLHDAAEFDEWLRDEWYKKDELMEAYLRTGRFPALTDGPVKYVEAPVRTRRPFEILQIFTPPATVLLLCWRLFKLLRGLLT
ncbi:hypothetical protein XA68_18293 [Ophiocordyceps unilateralis]|uniref:Phospholipid/glycerol acyltransferase domain-containing protein n=1 Tax=Ophiocordyceps unilateralis TaxID=268505 RepID=A0A2A9PHW2_OPHUN|nr:hypothetical protein XA68_18293 [Ophiocordyceps unilateralis]